MPGRGTIWRIDGESRSRGAMASNYLESLSVCLVVSLLVCLFDCLTVCLFSCLSIVFFTVRPCLYENEKQD